MKTGLRSAVEMYEKLSAGPLSGLRVGLLHGRLDADDKEVIMRRFQRGETDVLVATTCVERLRLATVLLLCRDLAIFFCAEADSEILGDLLFEVWVVWWLAAIVAAEPAQGNSSNAAATRTRMARGNVISNLKSL